LENVSFEDIRQKENLSEECWRKLDQELNWLFDTLDYLRAAALSALNRIEVTNVTHIHVRNMTFLFESG
jgi:hypothetical protein